MRILVVQESDWTEVGPHQSHHLMERLSQHGHEKRRRFRDAGGCNRLCLGSALRRLSGLILTLKVV